eukprot:3188809-Prymnesium_polylepis.2
MYRDEAPASARRVGCRARDDPISVLAHPHAVSHTKVTFARLQVRRCIPPMLFGLGPVTIFPKKRNVYRDWAPRHRAALLSALQPY